MIPHHLTKLEGDLRKATESQQFEEAERLIVQYCHDAIGYITSLNAGSLSGAETANRVSQVLDWAHLMLLAARVDIADSLSPLPLISRYLAQSPCQEQTRLEA